MTCLITLSILQTNKEEIVRWEEGKKWQARMEKVRNILKEKERETESVSKQLSTLKELYARLEPRHSWCKGFSHTIRNIHIPHTP